MKNILGRKVGMTSVFTDDGRYVPVTVIEAGPCTVVERRTKEKHGYDAVALGFGAVKKRRVTRALAGNFKKQGVEPARFVREFRGDDDGVRAVLGHLTRAGVLDPAPAPPDRAVGRITGGWDRRAAESMPTSYE